MNAEIQVGDLLHRQRLASQVIDGEAVNYGPLRVQPVDNTYATVIDGDGISNGAVDFHEEDATRAEDVRRVQRELDEALAEWVASL